MFHLNSVWRDSRYLFFLCLLLKFVTWLWWLLNLCFYLPLKSQCYIAQTIFEFLLNCLNLKNQLVSSFYFLYVHHLWVMCKTSLIGSQLKKIIRSGDRISPWIVFNKYL
jgi:hypothetical protein